jgi:predicted dienelactone hydrolase
LLTQDVTPDAPLKGERLPLVVISHGNGGSFSSHADTAYALAEAGFVAAALTHTGDNYRDQSRALDMPNRPRQLGVMIDWMIAAWRDHAIDPDRVGAFGFSSGGFTVLAAAGGNPDFGLIAPHCALHAQFFDCQLQAQHGAATPAAVQSPVFAHDPHIRAIVAAAPALGFTFAGKGLSNVAMPVQLWQAQDDRILPAPFYVEPVKAALPNPPEFHMVEHAGHFDFLTPCSPALATAAPAICASEPGFDRALFHTEFDGAVTAFFQRTLAAKPEG